MNNENSSQQIFLSEPKFKKGDYVRYIKDKHPTRYFIIETLLKHSPMIEEYLLQEPTYWWATEEYAHNLRHLTPEEKTNLLLGLTING